MSFPTEIVVGFLAIVCGAMGWWLRDLWDAHKALRKELSEFKETVPKEYVAKVDFKEDLREIKATLNKIFDELRDKADK